MDFKAFRLHLSFTQNTTSMDELNDKLIASRRSKTQMLELLNEYDKSTGMTIKAFCRHHQINVGSFYTARKRHSSRGTAKQQSSGFVAITRSTSREASGSLFAEVKGIRLYQVVSADFLKALVS